MSFNHEFPFLPEKLVEKGKWETVETCGSPPSPRTCHSMVSVGSKFYVFGGGLSGPDPVPDTTVHVFNTGEIYNIMHTISKCCGLFPTLNNFFSKRKNVTCCFTNDNNLLLIMGLV